MARSLLPFVQNGYYASRNWIPLVKGNGFTTSGGGEQEEVWETASGPIVTFDAVPAPLRQLSVAVKPVQNLNGYDNPWPAGGGKNLLPPQNISGSMSSVVVSSDGDFVTLNGTASAYGQAISSTTFVLDAGTYFLKIFVASGSVSGGTVQYQLRSEEGRIIFAQASDGIAFTLSEKTTVKARVTYTSGTIISNYIIRAMVSSGSTAQDDFSPYSNICPISGHTDADVTRTGKNMIDDGYSALKTNEVTLPTGTYYLQAFITENPSKHTTKSEVYINGEWETVTTPFSADGGRISITGNEFGWLYNNAMQTIVVTSGTCTIRCNRNDVAMLTRRLSLSTEQQTEFSPYVGTTYTIQLGDTVYGGTLDVVNGKMTVDRAMVDFGTLAWSYTGTLFMTNAIPGIKPPPDGNTVPNCICEAYEAVAYSRLSATDPSFTIIYEGSSNAGRLWLKDSTFTDLVSFKSFISGKHLCYELATPFELTLTPEQISTLQGTNNVWSDAGDVTVEYRAQ